MIMGLLFFICMILGVALGGTFIGPLVDDSFVGQVIGMAMSFGLFSFILKKRGKYKEKD